ncbi:MAG: BON domain-containing protein [Candidatus Marinimicrobia bacterium]|nr:BON domain-containing protein [Candidatus Neomarinimicrobiota bacterium]
MFSIQAIGMKQFAVGLLGVVVLMGGSADLALGAVELNDRQISNAVDDELIKDPAVSARAIDVSTAEGVVTLTGSVNNLLAKERAENIAATVKGVRAVVNRIDVSAPYRADKEIDEDIDDALRWDPVTESWELTASVDNGIVTLTGTVDSWQEAQLAATVAKGVRGVKGVANNIMVDYKTDRPNREIQEEVAATLRWDLYVDDGLIEVSVDNGHVALTGTVGSLAEKNRAYSKAWVAGVKSVDNSGLNVKGWARDARLRTGKYIARSDAEIKAAVNDALVYDPRVVSYKIDVESTGGYVTLRGTVDNLRAKRAAAQDARNVVGVWSINNKLKVRPGTPSDRRIEVNLKNALARDPSVERYQIDVSVVDGEVYLAGAVDSTFEKAVADNVAARQLGVEVVHNFLTVNNPNFTVQDPYTDEWYLYDYDWYVTTDRTTTKSDWEIEVDIKAELFWSPFVDSEEVTVSVDNAVVTLTGTVDTWAERQAATENAIEGGAVAVDNELAVIYGPNYYTP